MTATMSPVHQDDFDDVPHEDAPGAPATVVVRRNAGLAALIGAGASAVAIAYLWRATQTSAPLDWVLCAVMAAIAASYLALLVDARTPLLVADDLGVRIRLGNQWRGLPWDAVGEVVVHERGGLLKDGRVVFGPHHMADPFEGLEARGRRAAALNQRLYGAALAVPLGLTTRVSVRGADLADGLATLARGRTEVVVAGPAEAAPGEADVDVQAEADAEASPAGAGLAPEAGLSPADAAAGASVADADDDTRHHGGGIGHNQADDLAPRPEHQDQTGLAGTAAGVGAEDAAEDPAEDAARPADPEARARRSRLGDLGVIVSRFAKGGHRQARRPNDADDADDAVAGFEEHAETPEPTHAQRSSSSKRSHQPSAEADAASHGDGLTEGEDDEPTVRLHRVGPASRPTVPLLRDPRRALRAEVVRDTPASAMGSDALLPDSDPAARQETLPEGDELFRGGDEHGAAVPRRAMSERRIDDARTRRTASREPLEPPLLGDLLTRPAPDPVIGPELAAARIRVGLSVDELAERTRIRPHVIESIEVDDFAPCGGDFYARGHLRTLARVLGRNPEPLLAHFDTRYATAPINARKVFEAELATGLSGSTRRSLGGPSWTMLVAAVLVLAVTWGAVRLFASEPPEVLQSPAPLADGSAHPARTGTQPAPAPAPTPAPTATPVRLRVVAAEGGSRVVVRDSGGTVVWAGDLLLGEQRTLRAVPPVRVRAEDAGAVEVVVNGQNEGAVGPAGQAGRRTFAQPGER